LFRELFSVTSLAAFSEQRTYSPRIDRQAIVMLGGAMLGPQGHADTGCVGRYSSRARNGQVPPWIAFSEHRTYSPRIDRQAIVMLGDALHGGAWPMPALLLWLPSQPVSACPCGPSMAPWLRGQMTCLRRACLWRRRSVALGQRAPNRATAREDGRGMGAGMKGGTGAALAARASPPHAKCGCCSLPCST